MALSYPIDIFNSTDPVVSHRYSVLFGQSPSIQTTKSAENDGKDISSESDFAQKFARRIAHLLRKERLSKCLVHLIEDTDARLEELAVSPSDMTDPFVSIFEIVFQLTIRTVGCNEIANDPALQKKILHLFETIQQSSTATTIIFPWFPSPALIKRTIAGGRLYMIMKKIVDERKKSGKREDDPLQYLIDNGDDINDIIAFIVGALFAGQLNSGINAAYVIAYLGMDPYWMSQARQEIETVLSKYSTDMDAPVAKRLLSIPSEVWETEFPVMDLCLRDSIRINLLGSAFRRNMSAKDIQVGSEIIPSGAFATYHLAEIHQDPSIYPNPSKWDPGRYLPDRAEHKKKEWGWVGWGVGRHPCLGMRFAKLEQNVIIAEFLMRFDYEVCDKKGKKLEQLPPTNLNGLHASKPTPRIFLKYKVRK
ncbi:MAG: hypothetical protein Q9187_007731 [Circinaria calcarea]